MSEDVNYQVHLTLYHTPRALISFLEREWVGHKAQKYCVCLYLHYIFSGKRLLCIFPSVYSSLLFHSLSLLVNLKFKLIAKRLALTMWFVQSLAQLHQCNANCGIKYSYKSFTVWLHEIRTIREQAQAEHLGKMKHWDFYHNCCFITETVLT